MFSRCPACQTVFRVRPEQLRAHQGQVRCGRCQATFNALDHLFEARGAVTPAATSTEAENPPPHAVDAPPRTNDTARRPLPDGQADAGVAERDIERFFILEDRDGEDVRQDELTLDIDAPDDGAFRPATAAEPTFDFGGSLDFEVPDRPLARRGPPAKSESRREPTGGEPETFPEFLDLSDLVPPAPDAQPPHDATPADHPVGPPLAERGRREPGIRAGTEDGGGPGLAAGRPEPARSTPERNEPAPTEPGPEGPLHTPRAAARSPAPPAASFAPDADESEIARLDAVYGAPARSPGRRWLLGLGIGVLLGALLVQATYLFREDLARRWPPLRPAFVAACERLGCTVPLPRVAGAISIEASDLQSEPGRPGRFLLQATMRNRAPHPLAHPHLELTLTDRQDRPLARRVLAPVEWVPAEALARGGLDQGFAPGRDLVLNLPFEAPGLDANGYRIYAFYP